MFRITLLLCFLSASLYAQSAAENALQITVKTLQNAQLGTSKATFLSKKPGLKTKSSTAKRIELLETVGKHGLEKVTYAFTTGEKQLLYQISLDFSDSLLRSFVGEQMFGPPNYLPYKDQWILGVQGKFLSLAWASGKKLSYAADLPGSEWAGSQKFKLPEHFEMRKNLPPPNEWPAGEGAKLCSELKVQIEAGTTNFASIKGSETNGEYECLEPLSPAAASSIHENADKSRFVINEMAGDMSIQSALDWRTGLIKVLEDPKTNPIRLKKGFDRSILGEKAVIWDVLDQNGNPSGVQVGILLKGELLYKVYLLVLKSK
ncbi:MAG: hypothetical protein KGS48_11080 [Bacteroidetes bacterium]|nr:hypothetical protein [Bacteroidota bacterium]